MPGPQTMLPGSAHRFANAELLTWLAILEQERQSYQNNLKACFEEGAHRWNSLTTNGLCAKPDRCRDFVFVCRFEVGPLIDVVQELLSFQGDWSCINWDLPLYDKVGS